LAVNIFENLSAARLETFMFENIPVDKIGVTNKRQTNLEYLGQDMIEAGNEFGAGTPYGRKVGLADKCLVPVVKYLSLKVLHSSGLARPSKLLEI
jgi:hypothetical protein